MLEYFEDLHAKKSELVDQMGDASPEEITRINKIMREIDKAIADDRDHDVDFEFDPESDDPQIAEWLQEMRDGKMPNLMKGLDG